MTNLKQLVIAVSSLQNITGLDALKLDFIRFTSTTWFTNILKSGGADFTSTISCSKTYRTASKSTVGDNYTGSLLTGNAFLNLNGKTHESQFYNSTGLSNFRNLEALSPELIYKIKIGNFLPDSIYRKNFQYLYTTLNSKSIAGYKADWFLSNDLITTLGNDLLEVNTKFNFISNFVRFNELSLTNYYPTNLTNYQLKTDNMVSLFFAQSKQVRVLNNWRSLKLQREG